MLKAIDSRASIDTGFFQTGKESKSLKEKLLGRLTAASIISLCGIAVLAIAIVFSIRFGIDYHGEIVLMLLAGGLLTAVGIALFIDLVRQEQEPLRRFLLGLCSGDPDSADDIAQDALVRAYVASGSFLGLSKFRTWLFKIAYNCYVDYLRRPHPRQAAIDSREALHLPAGDESDSHFRYQHLYQALDRIPEKERASIVLFYFEDRSIKEIATILSMPAGTVKYHLSMGREHLKKLLSI